MSGDGGDKAVILSLGDVLDLRAYERARDGYRRQVMARKRRRRVSVGPVVTLLFECWDTVRFQVHEMARAEKIATDEGLQGELDVYNRLLPAPDELSATLFIELTSEDELRHWLPRMVGIERSVALELAGPEGAAGGVVTSVPEAMHAEALTREAVTPAVHYLRFPFGLGQVARFAAGPVTLAVHHPEYDFRTSLPESTHQELLIDLEGRFDPLPLG